MPRKKKVERQDKGVTYTRRTRGKLIDREVLDEIRKLKCSIHMLKSDTPMTFEEIVKAHGDYKDGYYHQGPFSYTEAQIQKGLEKLVELGVVETSGASGHLVLEDSLGLVKDKPFSKTTVKRASVRNNVSRVSRGRKTSKAGSKRVRSDRQGNRGKRRRNARS